MTNPSGITAWIANLINSMRGGSPVTPTVTSQRSSTVTPTFAPMQMPQMYGPSAPRQSTPSAFGIPMGGQWQNGSPSSMSGLASGEGGSSWDELMARLGGLGDGTDNSLGWAQLDWQKQRAQMEDAQFAQSLAQAMQIEQARQAQQQREMAAQLGNAIAGYQSQQWATSLPWKLPTGTQYAPGMEPGGAASRMAQMARTAYNAPRVVESNAPSREEMERWLESALRKFGPQ